MHMHPLNPLNPPPFAPPHPPGPTPPKNHTQKYSIDALAVHQRPDIPGKLAQEMHISNDVTPAEDWAKVGKYAKAHAPYNPEDPYQLRKYYCECLKLKHWACCVGERLLC